MREDVDAIERAIDGKRAAEATWTATKIASELGLAPFLHQRDAFDGLQRAYENAGSFTVALARQIEAVGCAVNLIDVGAMRRAEKRCVPLTLTAVSMTRGISREVRFRLNYSPRGHSFVAIAHENASQQCSRQRLSLDREIRRPQPAKRHAATFSAASARAL
jgi:hypothetical protein